MRTTAGSLALFDSRPTRNAKIVDMLIQAGAMVLGQANLSEPSNYRGIMMLIGWSAVGGQAQSAYVRGCLDPRDKVGHSSPSGSSTGSAVAVSAGYAPISIGTETDGSLTCPTGRAALYILKPTIGLVPQAGIVPVSKNFDSAGPLTKTVYDLAVLLDAISENKGGESFTSYLTASWDGISVATVDPEVWKFPDCFIKPVPEATEHIISSLSNREICDAYRKIKTLAKHVADDVPLITKDKITLGGEDSEMVITRADLKAELNHYLRELEESTFRSLPQLIEFNFKHAERELPPDHDNQDFLLATEDQHISEEQYCAHFDNMPYRSRDKGVDFILEKHNVDVIIGPSDDFLSSIAACAGYPIAQAPLSYLEYNERPFGVSILAKAGQDALLVKVLSAWEATFPRRRSPPLLEGE
ncbi:amidase signature enzyme [Trematosphaeria pertusa]|uniref:Amidase signature enzyme n=1 Tax=Trematosphaeria pertusa TaxID=390896 RepID=A0A6A6HXI9_9PLEO|nr:amidase signature enzyme [Trematosphaeria pertusa]KAF2242488.1 amidase signature enzyme [Trematosphaeria pertusa]